MFTVLTTIRKMDNSIPLDNVTTGTLVNIPTTSQFTNLNSALRSITESMIVRSADILVSATHFVNQFKKKKKTDSQNVDGFDWQHAP